MRKPNKNYAYVDGSFNPKTNTYGCGVFLVDQFGREYSIHTSENNPETAKMRNVAGEILGVKLAVKFAEMLNMKRLKIFHDYEGLEKWVHGSWQAKKPETKEYVSFVKAAIERGLKVYFQHVRGHSGDPGNERADQLAKKAVGI